MGWWRKNRRGTYYAPPPPPGEDRVNKISLNFMKTEFLLFGNQSQSRNLDDLVGIRVKGKVIGRANSTEYLGTIIHESLKWDEHVSYISSKYLRNIGAIKRVPTFLP